MMEGREQPGPGASEAEVHQYLQSLCSDATLFNRKEGFFTHFIEQIDAHVSDAFYKKFHSLKTDEARILDTWAIKPIHTLKVQSFYKEKNTAQGEYFRMKGNMAFQNKDNLEALVMYSRAILNAPNNSEECLSLSYANRSAVMYHLDKHKNCLADIDLAIETGYPSNLTYKVFDRRGQCLVKLGQYSQALEAFQSAEAALSNSTLDEAKMEAWKKDFAKKRHICQGKADKVQAKASESGEAVFGGPSNVLPHASVAVAVEETKEAGRYAVVTRPVGAGQVLISEDPYAFVLQRDRWGTHCLNCSTRLLNPVACNGCSAVSFCSRDCRSQAQNSYHRWECRFGDLLTGSGMSLNCDLALRIITKHNLEYFKELQPRLKEPPTLPSDKTPHRPADYVTIYQMVTLQEKRSPEDFLERSLMACFLLKVLQRMDFFGRWDEDGAPPDRDLTEDELFIGSLLLRNLQVLQFNSHEVTGIGYEKDIVNFKGTKNLQLGLSLYPTVTFCNHSCYPAVARYFQGTKMVVLNIRPLVKGDVVAENYGPVFTHHEIQQRQRKLLSRYWFKCECEACKNNWPVYESMPFKRKLRCQTCSKVLNLIDPSKNLVKCAGCNTQTNVKEALIIISQIEEQYLTGKMHMDNNLREEAIKTFTSYVDSICKYIVPPVKELHQSLDNLRLLIAARGTIQMRNPLK